MTVTSATNRSSYAGNGGTTAFTISFRILDEAHLSVTLVDDTTLVETAQVLTTNYTIAGVGDPTGTLTMLVAPPTGTTLIILRNMPVTQQTDYVTGAKFPADSHEDALDKLTMIAQEYDERHNRLVEMTISWTGTTVYMEDPVATSVLQWNATGDGIQNGPTTTEIANAEANAVAAAASYDAFDDRYLGDKASNPTLDNDGDALLTGALYWNTGSNEMRVYTGSVWTVAYNTSLGIADNATKAVVTIGDAATVFGDAALAETYHLGFKTPTGDGLISLGSDDTAATGTALWLYPASHGSLAYDMQVRANNNIELGYDHSASEWDFQANDIITTGGVTASNVTSRGSISGLELSNGTDATNDIDIAAGVCAANAAPYPLMVGSAITKQLDAAWAVGTNAGGRDTGSISDATWFVFEIMRSDTGVKDVLMSLSPTAPTMPANYDFKRRIGCIIRSSSTIQPFNQFGDEFFHDNHTVSSSTTVGTTAVLHTVETPVGIKLLVHLEGYMSNTSSNASHLISDPDIEDSLPGVTRATTRTTTASPIVTVAGSFMTNTSAQIRTRSEAATSSHRIAAFGWADTRGRFD